MLSKNLLSKLVLVLNFFVVLTQSVDIRQVDQNLKTRIDNFVENVYLPSMNISGCSFAVVRNNGQLLYTTGYGYADHGRKIPNGNQTQFMLGSTSKSVSAVVVVKALHEHFPELDEAVLDTPIRELMPKVNFTLNDRVRSEHTTFRDLLSHRTCLPREDFSFSSQAFDSTDEILYRQRYAQEACGFRSQFLYNNQMVLLATDLIGQLVNENFVEYAERFMKELGMQDSAFIRETDDFSKMENRALPYYVKDGKNYPFNPELTKRLTQTQAIGGLFVSSNDMARFMRFQMNMGELDGEQILPKNVMSWLSKPSIGMSHLKFRNSDEDNVMDSNLAYGLALIIGTYDGWERISHNGVFYPYRSEMSWYPELKLGIFSATHESPNLGNNAALHTFVFEALKGNEKAEQIAFKLLKEKRRGVDFAENKKDLKGISVDFDKSPQGEEKLDEFTLIGDYGNLVSGKVKIFPKFNVKSNQSELYVSHGKWLKGWLERVGTQKFSFDDNDDSDPTQVFKVHWDTNIVHDNHAHGEDDFFRFVTISKGGTFTFMITVKEYGMVPMINFEKGVEIGIENLDPVPWKEDRCE